MDPYSLLARNCQDTIESLTMTVDAAAANLAAASEVIGAALLADRKVIACGCGGDAALAQLFTSNMVGHFQRERPALPAMTLAADGASLATIAGQYGPQDIFCRQLQALGQAGDVLLCICSASPQSSLLAAVAAAHERNMAVVLLSNGGGTLRHALARNDTDISVAAHTPARVLELHTVLIQNLCELIDYRLFGSFEE